MDAKAVGRAFVDALVAKDFGAVRAMLADDVRFRFLIPGGPGQASGAEATAGRFSAWFGDADPNLLEWSRFEEMAGRLAIAYRCRVREPSGWLRVEQSLLADVDGDGRLAAIDLLCSGFRPLAEPGEASVHHLDAGDLGCGDGLAGEIRRGIEAIPVGDVLVVSVSDPAAKEDVPPLARMLGHSVRSIESAGDGRLQITLERGR